MTVLRVLGLENIEQAAAIHAQAMADGLGGKAWTADTFATLLATQGTFGWMVEDAAVMLVRQTDETAEIFTIGVAPSARRMGLARALLQTAYVALQALGAMRLQLEVAVDNLPAQHLYRTEGFEAVGRRPNYYKRGSGSVDALIMERQL